MEDPADSCRAAAETAIARCDILASFSEDPDRLTRTFLMAPMHDVHDTVSGWMRELGMGVTVDAIGNILGRWEASVPGAPALVFGSHLDTVPDAGRYDGILGVILGLAVVQRLEGRRLPFAVEVIGFSEEEGVRFAQPYLGSLAVVGRLTENDLSRRDADGTTMADAIRSFGGDPDALPTARRTPESIYGYIEAHIEQGPALETAGLSVGIVRAIAGQSRLRLRFTGAARHAGTTPMRHRSDALAAAAQCIGDVERHATGVPDLVATVGFIDIAPNASNVIPGEAVISLDVRHPDDAARLSAVETLLGYAEAAAAARGVTLTVLSRTEHPAVAMDPVLRERLHAACLSQGYTSLELVSGAGHDAAVMASLTPAAMLFLRSPGGISHHPDESVRLEDVEAALRVLSAFVREYGSEF